VKAFVKKFVKISEKLRFCSSIEKERWYKTLKYWWKIIYDDMRCARLGKKLKCKYYDPSLVKFFVKERFDIEFINVDRFFDMSCGID